MEDLKDEIAKQLLELEHMILEERDKKEIAEQKRLLDILKPKTTITLVVKEPLYPNKLLPKKESILDLKERAYNVMCEEVK